MDQLIAKLEAATGPDRELDAALYEHCGMVDEVYCEQWCCQDGRTDLTRERFVAAWAPPYTENVADALLLKPDNFTWAAGDCNEDNSPWACLTAPDGTDYASAAATESLALCIAALRARAMIAASSDGKVVAG